MDWTAPQKPAEWAENRLIDAILEGHFPIGSALPAERELAAQLGVTRPTLREALQRLARDGWIEIHQGRPTRVRDYWHEGNLGVLGAIAQRSQHLPPDFVPNLLYVRLVIAPAYARLAVEHGPARVVEALAGYQDLPESAEAFAAFDWQIHYCLTIACDNPIFTLILNGFCDLYQPMACRYFRTPDARRSSRLFYADLYAAAQAGDAQAAEDITRRTMQESRRLWRATRGEA
jgi:GntR family transcriptional regulator, negative regulator for fad regulon and positive regulator of fabA